MVAPPSSQRPQTPSTSDRVIIATYGVGILLTIPEAQARIQEVRNITPEVDITRRELLDYMSLQEEADYLEYQISRFISSNSN